MASPIRNRPLRALRALKALSANPDDLPKVFTVIDSLPGRTPFRLAARMKKTEDGRRLLATRPDLAARLADRAALRALPEGTLGRAYVELCEKGGITPSGIVEASKAGSAATEDDGSDVRFSQLRMRDTHDLWHVVTGYGLDVLGEGALLAFTYAQTGHPGIALICGLSFVYGVPGVNTVLLEAYRRGKKAAWLPAVVWEELLERPLDEVRARLGVGAPPSYTPFTSADMRQAGLIPAA
jgi:ubiquinone biosynthesis protein COQ4